MKNQKNVVFASMFFALMMCNFLAFAQLDNLSNMSAEWMRTSARNAATDATDIVVYNPAGLTMMRNGFHINVGNQSLFRNPSHRYDLGIGQGEKNFKQDGADAFIPNVYAAYKMNQWAVYGGMFISGGGATLNYPEGSITTDMIALQSLTAAQGAYGEVKNQHLKASSYYLTGTIGMAYQVNKYIGLAVSGRYYDAKNKTEAGMILTSSPFGLDDVPLDLKTTDNATSYGAVMNMNITANEKMNFSVRYETQAKLDFKTKQTKDDYGVTKDGAMNRRDLPAVLAIGANIKVCNKVKMLVDYNYYFQKQADWGKSTMVTEEKSWSSLAGDAATYAMGFQYSMTDRWMLSAGGAFSDFAYADKAAYYTRIGSFEVVQDDNYNINCGFACKVTKNITVNAGYMHTFWQKDETVKALNMQPMDVDVTVNNSLDAFAIGVDLNF